jgi:hypothetical protein
MIAPAITHDRLRALINYDPESGLVTFVADGSTAGYFDKSNGYWRLKLDGVRYYLHNLIWFWVTGVYPGYKEVDHHDTDRGNNKWVNLRKANPSLQQANRGAAKNNKLGVKGVSLCKATGRYRADIIVKGKRINLGRRETIEGAAELYAIAASQYYGEFARTA